jgi:hypothetical protein
MYVHGMRDFAKLSLCPFIVRLTLDTKEIDETLENLWAELTNSEQHGK